MRALNSSALFYDLGICRKASDYTVPGDGRGVGLPWDRLDI